MKWLFGALLLANLALLGWGMAHEPAVSGREPLPAVSDGIAGLQLLNESPTLTIQSPAPSPPPVTPKPPPRPTTPTTPAPSPSPPPPKPAILTAPPPAATSQPATTAPPPPARPAQTAAAPVATVVSDGSAEGGERLSPLARCHTFGPFTREYLANRATSRAEGFGVKVSRRSELTEQQVGYWIFLPPYASRSEAQQMTRELAAKGIDDFFIINSEPMENAISLGVYKNRAGAERRVAEVRARGFSPTIQPRTQPATHYWLDLVGVATPAQWGDLDAEYPGQRRVEQPCE